MSIGRRTFLALSGATVALSSVFLPRWTWAQRRLPVIGFLHGASADAYATNSADFAAGLGQVGFVEAQNLAIEYRFADARPDRLAAMAADLIEHRVTLIVAGGARAAAIAAASTATIPIIFITGFDPVELNLVASFELPGSNVTGVTFTTSGLFGEKLALLGQLVPEAERIGYLTESPSDTSMMSRGIEALKAEMLATAGRLGREVLIAEVGASHDYEAAFASFDQRHANAVVVAPSLMFANDADEIVGVAAGREIPSIYPRRADVVAGGLMSYGARLADAWRGCGVRVGEILKGDSRNRSISWYRPACWRAPTRSSNNAKTCASLPEFRILQLHLCRTRLLLRGLRESGRGQ
jgi:putative ABC transport system substrate-binding protein